MTLSHDVTKNVTDMSAEDFNNLRADVLSITTGHSHDSVDSKVLANDSVNTAQIATGAVTSDGVSYIMGAYVQKAFDTTYLAETDGIVTFMAYASGEGAWADMIGYVEAIDSSPDVMRCACSAAKNAGAYGGGSFPVARGEYWIVTKIENGDVQKDYVWWKPIGTPV